MPSTTPQEQVSWGVIDVAQGRWEQVLEALSATGRGRTLAVMQSDANVLVALSRQYEIPAIYLRAEDLLADPGVTAVYVGSPVQERASLAARALDAGKHVLMEAGLVAAADFAGLVEAARRHPELRAAIVPAPRHATALGAARELVRVGALGRIVHARVLLAQADDGAVSGTRLLWELAHRSLAAATYVTGSYPVAASATVAPGDGDRLPDCVDVTFTLPDGGLLTVQCLTRTGGADALDRFELHGTDGSMILDGSQQPGSEARLRRHLWSRSDQQPQETLRFAAQDDAVSQVSEFLDGIAGSTSTLAPIGDAWATAAAVEAAVSSAREGRRVPVTVTRAGDPR